MKIIKFPFVLRSDDFWNCFIDCNTLDEAKQIVTAAEDHFGVCISDQDVRETTDEDTPIYDALSVTKYPSLGYKTKDELLSAYDKLIADATVQAYSLDNVESAVIGITPDYTRFVYDYDLLIKALMDDDTDETSAIEWYEYNIVRSFPYYQPSPIVVHYIGEE